MLKRILIGSAAGAAATVPMSGVVWGFRNLGIYKGKPAPEAVSEHSLKKVMTPSRLPAPAMATLKAAQHFGFGAAAGGLFGAVTQVFRPTIVAGLLAGLGIWKAGYDGLIPAMGILPPPEDDEKGRALTMIVAHAVYGLALGAAVEWMMARPRLR